MRQGFSIELTSKSIIFCSHIFEGQSPAEKYMRLDDLGISAALPVLHYGGGIFDGWKLVKGEDGKWRFVGLKGRPAAGLRQLRILDDQHPFPCDEDELQVIAEKLVELNGWEDRDQIYLRLISFPVGQSVQIVPAGEYSIEFILMAWPFETYGDGKPFDVFVDPYSHGRSAWASSGSFIKGPGEKSYTTAAMANVDAPKGMKDVLMASRNKVLGWLGVFDIKELTTSSLFFVNSKGEFETAPFDGTFLDGSNRQKMIYLLRKAGYTVRVRRIGLGRLRRRWWDPRPRLIAAFGTGTARAVAPIKGFKFVDGRYVAMLPKHELVSVADEALNTSLRSGEVLPIDFNM